MKVKVFWKNNCPNCPPAKDLGNKLKNEGFPVIFCNIDEVDGLTEATLHDVLSTPSIIVVDDNDSEIKSWRTGVPNLEEIKDMF